MSRILLLEDDMMTARALKEALVEDGVHVDAVASTVEADLLIKSTSYDLILLDLSLSGSDGLSFLSSLRSSGSRVPVIIITARGTVRERVLGLKSGADDYLVKPFALSELLARVDAIFRRTRDGQASYRVCGLHIDVVNRTVSRGQAMLDLTVREFDIIAYLARHAGRTVSREMLARDVWKIRSRATSLDNSIDVTMSRLRRKLDMDGSPGAVETLRGVGYRLGDSP